MPRRLIWTGLLAGAQAGDLATTWLGLRFGVPEGNPLVQSILARGDFLLFGAVKLALVLALGALLAATGMRLQGRVDRATWRVTQALACIFVAIAAANTAGVLLRIL
jgi:Domain of unknown function (DUF5658)